ncbi:MAG: hypothetical protein LRY71_07180 [Bacillaceae bacterium]|nr:hypothetical protein [Bacillaceae bacterium]
MNLFLIRHGQSIANESGIIQGTKRLSFIFTRGKTSAVIRGIFIISII